MRLFKGSRRKVSLVICTFCFCSRCQILFSVVAQSERERQLNGRTEKSKTSSKRSRFSESVNQPDGSVSPALVVTSNSVYREHAIKRFVSFSTKIVGAEFSFTIHIFGELSEDISCANSSQN